MQFTTQELMIFIKIGGINWPDDYDGKDGSRKSEWKVEDKEMM